MEGLYYSPLNFEANQVQVFDDIDHNFYAIPNPDLYPQDSNGKDNNGRVVSKREYSKSVTITKNGVTSVLPDNPDQECLSGVQITTNVPFQITITDQQTDEHYNTILIPIDPVNDVDPTNPSNFIQPTITVKNLVTKNEIINQNGEYDISADHPETEILDKVHASVNVPSNFYYPDLPSDLNIIYIRNEDPDTPTNQRITYKNEIDKTISVTENGSLTVTPNSDELYKSVTIQTNVPQNVTVSDSSIPTDCDVLIVPSDGETPERKVKMYEDKIVTVNQNGVTTVTASNPNTQILRSVRILTNVADSITVNGNDPVPGYQLIFVPLINDQGEWLKDEIVNPTTKKIITKNITLTNNGNYTIECASNELMKNVQVSVNVPNMNIITYNSDNLIPGYDTYIIPKGPNDNSDPMIKYVNKEEKTITITSDGIYTINPSEGNIIDRIIINAEFDAMPEILHPTYTYTTNGTFTENLNVNKRYDTITTTVNVHSASENISPVEVSRIYYNNGTFTILPDDANHPFSKVNIGVNVLSNALTNAGKSTDTFYQCFTYAQIKIKNKDPAGTILDSALHYDGNVYLRSKNLSPSDWSTGGITTQAHSNCFFIGIDLTNDKIDLFYIANYNYLTQNDAHGGYNGSGNDTDPFTHHSYDYFVNIGNSDFETNTDNASEYSFSLGYYSSDRFEVNTIAKTPGGSYGNITESGEPYFGDYRNSAYHIHYQQIHVLQSYSLSTIMNEYQAAAYGDHTLPHPPAPSG